MDRKAAVAKIEALRREMDAVQAKAAPLRKEKADLLADIAAKRARLAEVTRLIRESDGERAREIPREMSAIAIGLGDPVIRHVNPGRPPRKR